MSDAPGSWASAEYVREWLSADALSDVLETPRRLSAAIVADAGLEVTGVIDVGSGPGAYLAAFLRAFPAATGVWLDGSKPMRDLAGERLSEFGDRVRFIVDDAERLGALDLQPAQVVTSSRTIHHLSAGATRRLYAAVHDRLPPGGFFFNLDHHDVPNAWEERYRRIRKQLLAGAREARPHRHDVPYSSLEDHLGWLEDAGFEPPDAPWRLFFTSLLVARKPE